MRSVIKIGLITTLNTNIGDDFIRGGICLIFRDLYKSHNIEYIPVNKHRPTTIYPIWHPIHLSRLARYLPRGRRPANRLIAHFAAHLKFGRFDHCDVIVQCGGPVLWPGCHNNEWAGPLWHEVIARLHPSIPVLNIAAGSCYPWEKQPLSVSNPEDAKYLQTIFNYCRLTTVRDRLAQHLYASIGAQTPLIACSAFLTGRGFANPRRGKGIVLINYMCGAGHYEWEQGISPLMWRQTVKELISRIQTRYRVAFLCHNQDEDRLAQQLDPQIPRFYPKSTLEYLTVVSNAQVGLCNRMHASVVMASLGIPSVAVCTDTRLLMVSQLGLPIEYVKNVDVDSLEDNLERLILNQPLERERLAALQEETWSKYLDLIGQAIHSVRH